MRLLSANGVRLPQRISNYCYHFSTLMSKEDQEPILKMHFTSNGGVAQHSWITHRFLFSTVGPIWFQMLTLKQVAR